MEFILLEKTFNFQFELDVREIAASIKFTNRFITLVQKYKLFPVTSSSLINISFRTPPEFILDYPNVLHMTKDLFYSHSPA